VKVSVPFCWPRFCQSFQMLGRIYGCPTIASTTTTSTRVVVQYSAAKLFQRKPNYPNSDCQQGIDPSSLQNDYSTVYTVLYLDHDYS